MRKEQLEVVLDMDGVLADFEGYFCTLFGKDHRERENLVSRYPEKKDAIINFVAEPVTYRNLRPMRLGMDIAKWLMERVIRYEGETGATPKHARAHVSIVTSRPKAALLNTKTWLKRVEVPHHRFYLEPYKSAVLERIQPDIIVDDIISICEETENKVSNVTPVLVAHPWNQTPFYPRISSVEQFKEIFHRVAREKLLSDFAGIGMAEDLFGS